MKYLTILFVLSCLTFWMIDVHGGFKLPIEKTVIKQQPKALFVFFDDVDKSMHSYLIDNVSAFYGLGVDYQPGNLPAYTYYWPRKRYRGDKLLGYLRDIKPKEYDYIIGFTSKDISTTKGKNPDAGVFGIGFNPGPACMVSSYRLKSDPVKCLTTILHEIGHNKGLVHCTTEGCLMQDAKGKMFTVPKQGPWMCDKCRKILRDDAQGRSDRL